MNQHIKDVCKIGQGFNCCKYLVMGVNGFECMKLDENDKRLIDNNWNDSKAAQSDNCNGKNNLN